MNKNCAFCDSTVQMDRPDSNYAIYKVICPNCGSYSLTHKESIILERNELNIDVSKKHLIAGYMREMNELGREVGKIEFDNLTPLFDNPIVPKTTEERMNKLLLYIYRNSKELGKELTFDKNWHPAVGYAQNTNELRFMMKALEQYQLIDIYGETLDGSFCFLLKPQGFTTCEELLNQQIKLRIQVFVAMAFTPEMFTIMDNAIRPAAKECGFEAFIVNDEEHNESINDKIIVGIKESRFIIADFTGQRAGVYFEAGFAQGMGLQVIRSCRRDDMEDEHGKSKLHFDVSHYNFIIWNNAEDLKEKLINRIKATIL